MRSIRFSLSACIVLLLVFSLAAVSVLVYEEAHRSLAEKKESMSELLEAKYQERCRVERAKLDNALLADARSLASIVEGQVQRERPDPRIPFLFPLGALNTFTSPYGHLTSPGWFIEGMQWNGKRKKDPGIFIWTFYKSYAPFKLQELNLPINPEGQVAQYYQINTYDHIEWKHSSQEDIELPLNPQIFSNNQLVDWKFGDVQVNPSVKVRRVILKISRLRIDFQPFWGPPRGGRPPSQRPPVPPRSPSTTPYAIPKWATLFIQSATDTVALQKKLEDYKEDWKTELADLESESQQSMASLRNRLLLISLFAFGIALLGVFWLVSIGLSPLRRLSDAVSAVSEKEFRLAVDNKQLPKELHPITERINQTLDLLKRAFSREKQAAADISHELRTPLAAMMTTLEVTLKKPRGAEEYHEVLEECRSAGQQMTQLVERMLALARLDAGADHLRPREIDVARLADQCATMVRPLAEARGVKLEIENNGPALMIADPDKLREVLTNLLHNAIEYNKPNGSIHMAVGRENGHLKVEVSDTGIGIAPEARSQIFERFYREDVSRTATDSLHAGIGLALVKGYVDRMGGVIEVDSVVGEGTTFRINLPAEI